MLSWTRSLLVAALVTGAVVRADSDRCTAILVGAKASTTGTPMTTHTNDCSSCDFRIVKVPARKHAPGALHDVVLASFDYPRYVGSARGSEYLPENLDTRFYNWTATPAIGAIPEVNETFAYIDGAYGIINEHQVAIGESTCGARFVSKPVSHGGAALFDVAELSRIALQRARTAREAITIMGDLAVEYGYYGAEWEGPDKYSEAGEALTVTDTAEAWMFHILPDDTGASAIWAAQRVPDNHITAVANQFVIRELNVSDATSCLASANVFDVARRNGLWNDSEPLDFSRVYSQPRAEGHQFYSTRRVWRVFTLADPALNLSADTDVFATSYPFSVAPARALSPHDIMRFQRDHYEGTPFDMTAGPDAGPFGDPDRYDAGVFDNNMTDRDVAAGSFERAISIFRASYSFVSVLDAANADNAFIWFGQYAPHATAYAPVYVQVASTPSQYARGSLRAFDRASSFWVHALVGNWAARSYKHAHPVVNKVQLELEALVASLQADVTAQAAVVKRTQGDAALAQFLTDQTALFASQSHATFSKLFEFLVTSFHDGYAVPNLAAEHFTVTPLFYPKWWLEQVGYFGDRTNATSKPAAKATVRADDDDSVDTIVFPPALLLPNATSSVVPTVAPAATTKPATKTPATAAPTAAPTTRPVVVTTTLPSPLPSALTTTVPATTTTTAPTSTTAAPVKEVRVRSSGSDTNASAAHTVSYWTAALFSLLSCVIGVVVGRTFKGCQKSGYRPIR